ncbi:MAG TPA: GWxTD domain-containing protein, partial [Caldithrix sp.]|nr:GWxTD domain-containing protein [Caldithrix sp.]
LNDDLTFVKNQDRFEATIQYEIYVNNQQKEAVYNKTTRQKIVTNNFDETNSRKINNTFSSDIILPAGIYDAVVTVLDKNSNKQVNRKLHFKIDDLGKTDFLMSDVLFFTDYTTDSTGRVVDFKPSLSGNFSGGGKYIYFYFTSVVKDSLDTLNVKYTIRDPFNSINQFNQYNICRKPRFQEHFIRLNRQLFDQNRYELEVASTYHNDTIKARRLFSFFWTIIPESPKDLNLALEQMRYILDADSVDWALKQPYKEKKAYFKRFWARMDPNKITQKNELMEEFYRRVNFATENFSTITIEGWRTDRGRIFIKFGEPDDIERHPFEMNTTPFEVWRYYNLRKVFVFVDRTGFGDYFLDPHYLDEEYN